VLLRLAYLTVTNTFSFLRLLPRSDRDKEIEILVLRLQLAVLQRQVAKPVFTPDDRFLVAGLLHRLPMDKLRNLTVLVRPDTILRRHRNLLRRHHAAACAPGDEDGRAPSVPSVSWCYDWHGRTPRGDRRVHGDLAALGIKVAASTVWEILRDHGIDPQGVLKRENPVH
jgi:putative transposase